MRIVTQGNSWLLSHNIRTVPYTSPNALDFAILCPAKVTGQLRGPARIRDEIRDSQESPVKIGVSQESEQRREAQTEQRREAPHAVLHAVLLAPPEYLSPKF